MNKDVLTSKEASRIKRFYLLPAIAGACLAVAFGLGVFVIAGEMINDLVFHAHGFVGWGIYFYIAVVVVYVTIFVLGMFIPRFGMMRKSWKETVEKVAASQTNKDFSKQAAVAVSTMAAGRLASNAGASTAGTVAQAIGGVEAVAANAEIASEMMGNAKRVADAAGVKLPSPGKTIVALIIVPILILCAIYAAEFNQSVQAMEANQAKAVQTFKTLEAAFSDAPSINENTVPAAGYNDNGYNFRAYANADEDTAIYVDIKVDYDGQISSLFYNANVVVDEPKSALKNRVNSGFAMLNNCVGKIDSSLAKQPKMLSACALPGSFWDTFNAGTYYDSISEAYNRDDNVRVYYSYHTASQDKFNKYTNTYISLSCK